MNIFNVAASSLSTVNTHATDALSHGSFYCHASGWQRLSSIYIDLARSCVINDRRVPRSSQPVNRQRRPDHRLTTDQCPLCHGQPSREDKFTNRGNCRTAERERCTRASWTFWYHNSIINCTSLLIFATTPLTIGQWTLARIIRSFKA